MGLMNLRNALMTGKRLPYDAEVEYIQGTGTQWIDTGVYGDENTVVQLSVQIGSYTPNVLFGCYNANGVQFNFFVRSQNWAYFRLKGSLLNTTSWGGNLNSRLDIELGNNYCKDLSSGTIVMQGDAQSSFTTDRTLKWFYYDRGSLVTGSGKIFFAKIYKSGVLVQDVIPVRKGAVGYLYDRVTGKLFGNAGTGDFVLGPDVVPVEYIESHGAEWIDTGYIATEDTRVVATLYTNETGNRNWFGGSVASADLGYVVNSYSPTAIELRFGNSNWQKPSAQNVVGKVFTIDFGKSAVKINGDTIYTPSYTVFGVQKIPIAIFVRYGGTGYIKGRAYSFKIYEDSSSVRSFLPIRVGNEGAMMDTLTRRIYRNAGTGAFTYGNDLKYPIPA